MECPVDQVPRYLYTGAYLGTLGIYGVEQGKVPT